MLSIKCPAEELNLVRQFRGLPCLSDTPAGQLSRPGIGPGHHAHNGPGPSEGPVRSTTPSRLERWGAWTRRSLTVYVPCSQRPLPRLQSRRLDSNQHRAVYKTAASPFGHVGFFMPMPSWAEAPTHLAARRDNDDSITKGRSARIRTLSSGFGGRVLSQEDTPTAWSMELGARSRQSRA